MKRFALAAAAVLIGGVALAGCGGSDDSGSGTGATDTKGPIKIWYSNNEYEVRLGQAGRRGLERRPPGRAGHRRGDPGRQVLRRGDRRSHHRRHHARA